jgi:predicted metal-dependent hydrolase
MMTQEEKDAVIWWAIDDALKQASSGFINYESMAREHITELVNAIRDALDRNGLEITERVKPTSLKDDTGGFIEKEGQL